METTPIPTPTLSARLSTALRAGDGDALRRLSGEEPDDWRELLLALGEIHDLHLAPLGRLEGRERFQHHPAVAELKARLEAALVDELDQRDARAGWHLPAGAAAALRAVAAHGPVPPVYTWLAESAGPGELRDFLALEGGPDGGFDDLVALCQVGLDGRAKLELAQNYADEMGNGSLDRVHTELHRKMSRALGLRPPPREEQPTEALERSTLNGLLGTNRRLQPEMIGALGLLELQAGPRCRHVVRALQRTRAGDDALDFYVEHAMADPRHGKDWVDNAVRPLEDNPTFAAGIVRGARWRSLVNATFFEALHARFVTSVPLAS